MRIDRDKTKKDSSKCIIYKEMFVLVLFPETIEKEERRSFYANDTVANWDDDSIRRNIEIAGRAHEKLS